VGSASSSRSVAHHGTGHSLGARTPVSAAKDVMFDRRNGETRHRSSFTEVQNHAHAHAGGAEVRTPASISGGTLRELEERLHSVEREARDALVSMETSSAQFEPGGRADGTSGPSRPHSHSPAPPASRGRVQGQTFGGRQAAVGSGRGGPWNFDPASTSPGSDRSRRQHGASGTHQSSRPADDAADLLCNHWESWAAEVLRATEEGGTLPPPPTPSPAAMAGIPHALVRLTQASVAAATTLAREGRDARMLRISVEELSEKLLQSKADARQLCDRVSELMRVHSAALRASEAEGGRLARVVQELTDQNSAGEAEVRRVRERSSELASALAAEAHERRQVEESLSHPCQGCSDLQGELVRLSREVQRMKGLLDDAEAQRIMDERDWKRELEDADVQRRSLVESLRQLLVHHDTERNDSGAPGPADHSRFKIPPVAVPRETCGSYGSPRERRIPSSAGTSRARTPTRMVHKIPISDGGMRETGSLSDGGAHSGRAGDEKDEDWAIAQANILSATRDIEAEIVELHRTLRESAGTPRSGQISPERRLDADGSTGGGSKTEVIRAKTPSPNQSSIPRAMNEGSEGG